MAAKTHAYVLAVLLPFAATPQNPCDPQLIQSPSNPYGYRLRGDRCEGLYVQEVGGAPLTIASWTESFENYDLTSSKPLLIEWETPASERVHLRAQALRRRLYFRMDAIRAPDTKSFSWNSDLLAAIGIARPELGLIGSIRRSVSGTEQDIYLPLRITQKHGQPASGAYQLIVIPGVELKELFITIAAVGGEGRTVLKSGEPLGYGYYPAERPVEIPVSGLPKPGIYRLEIGATLRSGGASTAELWFYHTRK
jgi:hypothetical protein